MTPFEGTSTCIETARPLQLLEVLSSVCALVFLSSRSLTSLQTSGGPLTSSRITPDSLLPFVHPPPLSSLWVCPVKGSNSQCVRNSKRPVFCFWGANCVLTFVAHERLDRLRCARACLKKLLEIALRAARAP